VVNRTIKYLVCFAFLCIFAASAHSQEKLPVLPDRVPDKFTIDLKFPPELLALAKKLDSGMSKLDGQLADIAAKAERSWWVGVWVGSVTASVTLVLLYLVFMRRS
jgi:hypothetical protein